MRLINFGTGEILDRLSILALKIQYGSEAGKEVKHFLDERNALLAKFEAPTNGRWLEHALELMVVNARLWQSEDELRDFRNLPAASGINALAFRIQDLNDRRAELIKAINKLTGDYLGEEKLSGEGR